jgi:hypothetical protein
VCGGEVPYAADLAPKNQKHPWPRAPERSVVATSNSADSREEPDHDGEARGRRGGPKTRRSTTQEGHEQKQPPTTARRQSKRRRHRQGPEQTGEVTSGARARRKTQTLRTTPNKRKPQN